MIYHFEDFLLLALLSLTYSTALVRVERLRLAVAARQVPNIDNLWAFAGVILLPPYLLVALAGLIYAGEWQARGVVGQPVGRYLYSAASLAASMCIGRYVLEGIQGPTGAVVAAAAYYLSNVALIAGAMTGAGHFRAMRMFTAVRHHLIELSTIGAGVVMAATMSWHTTAAAAALPMLGGLHRAELRATIRSWRAFDPVTGLWNERAWKAQGRQMLQDTTGHVALLIMDPDGDGMESAMATNLGKGIRPGDLVGHYGTRQVILMMPAGPACVGRIFAGRIGDRLAAAGIAATLGYATTDDGGVDDLVIAAMCDLMAQRELAGVDRAW